MMNVHTILKRKSLKFVLPLFLLVVSGFFLSLGAGNRPQNLLQNS